MECSYLNVHFLRKISNLSKFLKLMFIFSVYTFSSSHIFPSRLRCSAIFWYDMFEPVQDMFEYVCLHIIEYRWRYVQNMFGPVDFHRAEEVRNFFKFHICQYLFSSSADHFYRFIYLFSQWSSTTANLPSKSRNATTVIKPSVALITWRST